MGVPQQTPEEFYRVSSYIPLLEEAIAQLERRFSDHERKAVHLLPSSVGSDTSWVSTFVETYQEILGCSSPEAEAEVKTWQHMWCHQEGEKPTTL